MKALAILLLLAGTAVADKRTAEVWLQSMTDARVTAPLHTAKRPLTYAVQSSECPKHTTGKITAAAELTSLKACFVGTLKLVAKEAEVELRDLKSKDLDGSQLRFKKSAPKGTAFVRANRSYAGQTLTITVAITAGVVVAVWFNYFESDGE